MTSLTQRQERRRSAVRGGERTEGSGDPTRRWVRPGAVVLTATVVLAVAMAASLVIGPGEVSLGEAAAIVGHRALHLPVDLPEDRIAVTLVWTLLLPPAVMAALVGAGLALAGVASQALIRNPLADPFILGVSGGASVGAVSVMVLGLGGPSSTAARAGGAFVGALLGLLLVMAFGARSGSISPLRVVLAGIAIGHLLAGLTTLLIVGSGNSNRVFGILHWLGGSVLAARPENLWLPALALVVGLVVLLLDAGRMNALLIGEETAASLGVNVNALRWRLVLVTAALAAVMVSQAGIIGFVGLVIPHMARLLVGSDHRAVIPVAAVGGAAFMVLCNLAARNAFEPHVIPVGVVAGVIGAPVFLWLISRGPAMRGV